MKIIFPAPKRTDYRLYQKKEEGWVQIMGRGIRTRKPRKSQYNWLVDGVLYPSMRDAVEQTGLTANRIRYMAQEDKFVNCAKIKKKDS